MSALRVAEVITKAGKMRDNWPMGCVETVFRENPKLEQRYRACIALLDSRPVEFKFQRGLRELRAIFCDIAVSITQGKLL